FAAGLRRYCLLEQPAVARHVAEDRSLSHRIRVPRIGPPADDEPLAFLYEDERLRLALVDRGGIARVAEADFPAARVVFDHDQHLDLVEVALADDRGRDLELEQRFF